MAASNENDNLMIDCDIIFTCENVSLYALVGTVNAEKDACLTERKTLQLLQTQHTNEGLYYLITIGENQLPLASHIPVLRTAKGNYIIPLEQSICYGIVFDVNTPDPFLKIFEDFLSGICTFRTKEQVEELSKLQKEHQQQAFQPQTQTQIQVNQTPINTQGISTTATIPQTTPQEDKPVSYMNSLAGYIKSGSTSLGEYIVKGSEYVGSALQSGGEKLKTHIPAGRHVPTHVPHVLHKTVHVAHAISPHTVKMSLGVLHGVSFVSRKIGGFVADKVSHSSLGKKLQEPSSPRVEAAKNVVGASVEGALVLWESLEQAGTHLLKTSKKVTVGVLDHKYGEHVALTADKGMDVAGDLGSAMYYTSQIGLKSLAKRSIRDSAIEGGKTLVQSGNEQPNNNNNNTTETTKEIVTENKTQ